MAQLGIVSIFARDCLVPRRGGSATGQELFDLYLDWCSRHGRVALRNGHFREDMQILARQVGMLVVRDGGNTVFLDVAPSVR